mgnify:CR=1 FL=1
MLRSLALAGGLVLCSTGAYGQFGTQVLVNGDFEEGSVFTGLPFNWTPNAENTNGERTDDFNNTPGGEWSASIPLTDGFLEWATAEEDRPMIAPPAPDGNGGDFTLSLFYNMPSEVTALVVGAKVRFYNDLGGLISETGDLIIDDRNTGGAWREITFTTGPDGEPITPPRGTVEVGVSLFTFDPSDDDVDADGTVYFDDVTLTQAEGPEACNAADIAAPFGTLDGADALAFVSNAVLDENVPGAEDNRVGNPSFETSMVDPDQGEIPADWFPFNFDPASDFYELGGEGDNPPANTGTRMIRVADDGSTFHGWTTDGPASATFNLENPVELSGFFNIPSGIDADVIAVKLEAFDVDANGDFAGNVVPVTLEGGPGSGDVLISDGSPTDGWEEFRITYPADRLPSAQNRLRPLVFLFDGGGIGAGDIFFDDVFIGQEGVTRGDFNNDGETNIFDVLEVLQLIDQGCP